MSQLNLGRLSSPDLRAVVLALSSPERGAALRRALESELRRREAVQGGGPAGVACRRRDQALRRGADAE